MPGRDLFADEGTPESKGRDLFADEGPPPSASGGHGDPLKFLTGVGEAAANMASGTVGAALGGLAGIGQGASNLVTQTFWAKPGAAPADVVQAVQSGLTYEPRTEAGKGVASAAAAPMEALANKAEQAGGYVAEKTGSPALGAAANTAIQAAPLLIGKAVPKVAGLARDVARPIAERVAKAGEERTAIRAAEEAPKNIAIEQAKRVGIKLPPSEAGGGVGKMLEGAGGKIQTEMSLSRANAKQINRVAAKEIGLSERQPMTPANIDRLKLKAFQSYDAVKKAGRISADDDFRSSLEKVKERTGQAQADYPEDTNELIDKEIAKFNKPSADASSMLEKIKSLRQRASKNMQAPDPEKFELGIAQKKIATAMEDLIDRQVSATNPDLIKNFRDARVQLAKIYNVEDALGPNGNISAAVLARQLKRGVPLSGGLKDIAELYQEFPKVMRYTDNLGGHAPFSALDYLVGGVSAVSAPHALPGIAAALVGRPVARGIIKSGAYQKAAIKPRVPEPSAVTKAARRIAGPESEELPPTYVPRVGDLGAQ